MKDGFGKAFRINLTHIVSGILELLVLDLWRDCTHRHRYTVNDATNSQKVKLFYLNVFKKEEEKKERTPRVT